MHLSRYLFLPTLTLLACSGGEDQSGPSAQWPDAAVTAAGTPIGELITGWADSSGRAVQAPDASVNLYVFPGAVDTFVEFGIQVISPTVPGGVRALRFTPADLTFAGRVLVELLPEAGDSLRLTGRTIGVHLPDGRWQLLDPTEVEEDGGGRLRFELEQFGDYALVDFVRVRPAVDTVNEGSSLQLSAEYCSTVAHLTGETVAAFAATCNQLPRPVAGDDDPPLTTVRLDRSSWTVNGVPGGAPDRGTISGGLTATYLAPDNLTVPNPVSVSITARDARAAQILTTRLHIQAGTNAAP